MKDKEIKKKYFIQQTIDKIINYLKIYKEVEMVYYGGLERRFIFRRGDYYY
jgi:hypothetical protein